MKAIYDAYLHLHPSARFTYTFQNSFPELSLLSNTIFPMRHISRMLLLLNSFHQVVCLATSCTYLKTKCYKQRFFCHIHFYYFQIWHLFIVTTFCKFLKNRHHIFQGL